MRLPVRALVALAALALAACGGGDDAGPAEPAAGTCTVLRPSESGPGDVDGYFPLALGDRRLFREDGEHLTAPRQVEEHVSREVVVDGARAAVLVTWVPMNGTVRDEVVLRNGPSGVSLHAPGALYPYLFLPWPLVAGSFEQIRCTGFDAGEDLDGDGRTDRFDLLVDASVSGEEPMVVPAGHFEARRLTGRTRYVVHGTRAGSVTGSVTEVRWLAPGVGTVRANVTLSGFLGSGFADRQLEGYEVGGIRGGLQQRSVLASGEEPLAGPPPLARLGDRTLLLSSRPAVYAEHRLSGHLLDGPGAGATFDVAGWTARSLQASVAASAGAFLVAAADDGSVVRAIRLDREGVALDPLPGLAIPLAPGVAARRPAVASDGTGWLVAWATRGGGTHAAWIGADGALLATAKLSDADTGDPAVAYAGGVYLVAFADHPSAATRLAAVRLSRTGTVLDASPFPIATAPGAKLLGGASTDGSRFLVTWADARIDPTGAAVEVWAARIGPGGDLLDGPAEGGGILVNAQGHGETQVGVPAPLGDGFVVTWWSGDRAMATLLGADGALLDGPPYGNARVLAPSDPGPPAAIPAADGETLVVWRGAWTGVEGVNGLEGTWYLW